MDEQVGLHGLLVIEFTDVWAGKPVTLNVTPVPVPETKVLVIVFDLVEFRGAVISPLFESE